MPGDSPLHSDHVNYIILRYLQEHGHENAARAFYRDWHRPYEFRDPEALPFARAVKRDALIILVQDGLFFDELLARNGKHTRRHWWATINPREPLGEEDAAALENGMALGVGSRPSSRGTKRKSRPSLGTAPVLTNHHSMRAPDEFPMPAPKRRRPNDVDEGVGEDAAQVNGEKDSMEVDTAAASPDDDGENGEGSPQAAETVDTPPVRFDSMDVMTQTDVKLGPKTSTIYWKLDKPGATVWQSMFNPDSTDPKNATTLLTVGQSLCRVYDVPQNIEHGLSTIEHVDDPHMPPHGLVTASAWHPKGHAAACAMEAILQLSDGDSTKQAPIQLLLNHGRDHRSSTTWDTDQGLLQPPGAVLCVRYSPKGTYLLTARINGERGLVQIWKTPTSDEQQQDGLVNDPAEQASNPIAWRVFDRQVLDACWINEDTFIVSGTEGLSSVYHLANNQSDEGPSTLVSAMPVDDTSANLTQRGLKEASGDLLALKETWDKVRFDSRLNVAVFASSSAKTMLSRAIVPEDIQKGQDSQLDVNGAMTLPGILTALAFQPQPSPPETSAAPSEEDTPPSESLLAATFEHGLTILYRLVRSNPSCTVCEEVLRLNDTSPHTLYESPTPALALAWSPRGTHFAIAGPEIVQVYFIDALLAAHPNGRKTFNDENSALVVWRADAGREKRNGEVNGFHHGEDGGEHEEGAEEDADVNGGAGVGVGIEPSLSWSADGEALGWACERQLAVIRFRPPLNQPLSAIKAV